MAETAVERAECDRGAARGGVGEDLPAAEVAGEPIALDVLFEDEFLLVMTKPPGMPAHPSVRAVRSPAPRCELRCELRYERAAELPLL